MDPIETNTSESCDFLQGQIHRTQCWVDLSVAKIKEDFMGLKNMAKITLLQEVFINNNHLLLPPVLRKL